MNEEIRPLYAVLQGYLSQIPASEATYASSSAIELVDRYHDVVQKISKKTAEDYASFKCTIDTSPDGRRWFKITELRMQIMGFINYLHTKYFQDEEQPFSAKPVNTYNLTNTQSQSQAQTIQLVIDVTEIITKNLSKPETTPEEKTFLQKVKDILPSINGGLDLIQKVMTIATQLGISVETVSKLLH